MFCCLAQWLGHCNLALQTPSCVLPLQKSDFKYCRVVSTVMTHQYTPPLHTKQMDLLVV